MPILGHGGNVFPTDHRSIEPARRGTAMIWSIVSMVTLMAFISLAVDMARVQVAKTELQRAADAASRYALTGISDGTYVSKAQTAASDNTCDGATVSLLSSDIQSGTWASGTFTAGGSSPNAIRIIAHRAGSRGTAIPLMFAQVVGMSKCDIQATSIAQLATGTAPYGAVGLSGVTMSGGTIIDSYNSGSGAYSWARG